MKKFVYLFVLSSLFMFNLSSCSKNEVTSGEAIISPSGVYFSDNIEGIEQHVKDLNLNAIGNKGFTIDSVSFLETKNMSVSVINFTTVDGISSNVLWYKNLPVKKAGLRQVNDYDISCDGCENCRVQAHVSEGEMDVQCESSCCTMHVNN